MLNKLSITDLDLSRRKVFIRVDFNVPLNAELEITDDTRIRASLPTIKHALACNAKVILASHMGRPKGKVVENLRLSPVALRLAQLLDCEVNMAPDCIGPEALAMSKTLAGGEVLLLENLRFHKGETDNDADFSKELASHAELYVNDAFGTAHRAHASTVGITQFLSPCAAGFLLQKEIEYFDNKLANPGRPLIALLGGAKVSTKIPVIENLLEKVDKLIIGGGMAFTFFKAAGLDVGNSLLEEDLIPQVEQIMQKAHASGKEIILPNDIVVAEEFSNEAETQIVSADGIPAGWMGLDIGPVSTEKFCNEIAGAATVVWNGPMGAFEMPNFSSGTVEIARAIADSEAVSIVGGGDSVAALDVAGVREQISHVSTGGGASLDFLAGKTLPAIEALTDKN